jgi:hypothetical protein
MSTNKHKTILVLLIAMIAMLAAFASSAPAATPQELSAHCANKTFTGFTTGLPDCRAVEIVSPANEVGDVYDPGGTISGHEEYITTARPFRSSADGSSVTYLADPGVSGGDGSTAKANGNQFLARRTNAGWAAKNITPSVGEGEDATKQRSYKYFSSDLSVGALASESQLSGEASSPQGPEGCQVLYGTENASDGTVAYSALFTETLTPNICGEENSNPGRAAGLFFAGETPDHAVKLFESSAALVAPAGSPSGFGGNIYVSTVSGKLTVVNILPNGSVEPDAVAGAPSEELQNGPDLSNVISPDGEKVIWSAVERGAGLEERATALPTALYAREKALTPSARTVELDAAQEGAAGPSGGGEFWASSADDEKVFFTDCHSLTADATTHEEGGCEHSVSEADDLVKTGSDLYEYQFFGGSTPQLSDITIDHDGADPFGADVQGVVGASEKGDFIYFVAGGALGAGPNSRGESPQSGTCETAPGSTSRHKEELEGRVPAAAGCNLFELHFNGEAWEAPIFIARLAAIDNIASNEGLNAPKGAGSGAERVGDWNPTLGSRIAEVTPTGDALVFSSTQNLTGYEVSSAGTATGTAEQGGTEIFIYNATANSLTCASCNPRNEAPDIQALREGTDTYLPVSSSYTFMHRWVNDAGTEVFFDTSQPLSEVDGNDTQDVYEWVAQGAGSCPVSTSVYGGCIFLLSSGESESFSFLVDTDDTGANVFVVHRGQLDRVGPAGTKSSIYDLRADGGSPSRPAEGCNSAATCPATPVSIPGGSALGGSSIAGNDNFGPAPELKKPVVQTRAEKLVTALRVCRRERARKRRGSCEVRARKQYGAKKVKPKRRKK